MRITMLTVVALLMAMQAAPTPPGAPAKEPLKLDEALLAPKQAASERADPAETPRDFDAAAFRAAIRKSESAMGAKDWAGAEGALQEALALKPDSKEAAYNLGVAQYMQGKFKDAAKRFEESAAGASSIKDARASADLAARSMYNEGRARYGELLDLLEKAPPAGATTGAPQAQLPPEQLKEAIKLAQNSLTHFKDAAIANPADQDSAANAETSLQLLKQLQKLEQQQQKQDQKKQDQKQDQQKQDQQKQDQQQQDQQQQQQQQDKNQDSKDQQSEKKDQQKSEDQKQQQQQQKNDSSKSEGNDSKQDQQQDDAKKPSEQDADKQQQSPDQKNEPQQQQQKDQKPDPQKPELKKDQPKPDPKDGKQDESKDQNGQPQQPSEAQQAEGKQGEQKSPSMQQAKADKLLQLVRDKEKARNAERQAAKGQIRPTPVDRDW